MPTCSQCHETEARYRCPGCQARTCSLACSSAHKLASKCSGQRDKTAFVPREEYGYLQLMEDYRFLEDVSRKFDQTKKEGPRPAKRRRIVNVGRQKVEMDPLLPLKKAAVGSGVNLVLLADGMERRRTNKTRIVKKGKDVHFDWQISWSFRTEPFGKASLSHPPIQHISVKNAATSPIPELLLRLSLASKLPAEAKTMLSSLNLVGALSGEQSDVVFLMPVPLSAEAPTRSAQAVHERIKKRPAPAPTINKTREPLPQFKKEMVGSFVPHSSLPARPGVHLPGSNFFAPKNSGAAAPSLPSTPPLPNVTKLQLAPAKRYWRLSAQQPLSSALVGCTIIEWPEIEVWRAQDFAKAQSLGYIELARRVAEVTLPKSPSRPSEKAKAPLSALVAYDNVSDDSGVEEGEVEESRELSSLVGLLPT